jgi:AcrR family transcriptional regulator
MAPDLSQSDHMTTKPQDCDSLSDIMSHKLRAPMSSRSKDLRAIRSGEALRNAMLDLLLEKSLEQITIRDICAAAGVHYATFFRHFQTKEALLDDIAKDQIRQINALTLAIRDADDFQAGFTALCEYVAEHRELWSTLLNGGAGSAMREEWLRQSQQVAAREEPINSWLPAELGTICAATLIAESLAWWVAQPEDAYSVEAIAGILHRMIVGSIIMPA